VHRSLSGELRRNFSHATGSDIKGRLGSADAEIVLANLKPADFPVELDTFALPTVDTILRELEKPRPRSAAPGLSRRGVQEVSRL